MNYMTKKLWYLVLILASTFLLIYYYSPEPKLPSGKKIDSLVVFKSQRALLAFSGGQLVKTYKISLGGNPIGNKLCEGDKKTPEGNYQINDKNPNSGYYKNLAISYPNQENINAAKALGKSAGGDVKIHGIRNGLGFIGKFHRWLDWTEGCIAVTDDEMEELYNAVSVGASIKIVP